MPVLALVMPAIIGCMDLPSSCRAPRFVDRMSRSRTYRAAKYEFGHSVNVMGSPCNVARRRSEKRPAAFTGDGHEETGRARRRGNCSGAYGSAGAGEAQDWHHCHLVRAAGGAWPTAP